MPLDARLSALVRPAAVAVHHDRHMRGHPPLGELGRVEAGPVDGAIRHRVAMGEGLRAHVAASTCSSERMPRSRCHCAYAAMRPDAEPRVGADAASTTSHSPSMSADEQRRGGDVDARRPDRRAVAADHPAELGDEGVVGAGRAAAGAVGQPGRPAGERHRAQQVRIQDAARHVLAAGERAQAADEEEILLRRRLGLVEPVGRLDHRVRRRVAVVVHGDVGAVRAERLGLLDDVERAPLVEQHIGDHERLEAGAEPRGGAPDAFGDGAQLAVPAAEHRDDAIRFTQLVGAQDHDFVAICGHLPIMAAWTSPGSPPGRAARAGPAVPAMRSGIRRAATQNGCVDAPLFVDPALGRPDRGRTRRHPGCAVRVRVPRSAPPRSARRRDHRHRDGDGRRHHPRHAARPAAVDAAEQLVPADRDRRRARRDAAGRPAAQAQRRSSSASMRS